MSQTTQSLVTEIAQHYRDILDEIWTAVEVGGEETRDYLDRLPLEVVWELGEPFAIVLRSGGPHVEITGGGRAQSGYVLTVYWGGERATVSGEGISGVGEWFRAKVETLN